jgi:sporulation protein YlmC with PRC-barrel domain
MKERIADLENLPRMSDVVGHKMVTQSGRLLGSIDDVLINGADGTIIGFAVGEGVRNKLENFFNPQRSRIHGYVRADADLQVGNELIVVPDDALIEGEPGGQEGDHKPKTHQVTGTESRGWGGRDSGEPTRPSIWKRRTDTTTRNRSQPIMEPRLRSETARPVENTGTVAPEISPSNEQGEAAATAPQDQRQG